MQLTTKNSETQKPTSNAQKSDEEKSKKIAPASATCCRTVTSEIQLTINNCIKRSNSTCMESKYKGVITSERLNQLKKLVEKAAGAGKIFTIRGNWNIIRQQLLKREWLEKVEPTTEKSNVGGGRVRSIASSTTAEDLVGNLPAKQDWETAVAYVEKCEKTVIMRLLQNIDSNFFWSARRDQFDQKQRSNPNKLLNRFSRSLFASKEGLALLLQNYYWFTEPNVATVNFPRCFVLGFPEHFNHFVDNFRMTACISMLKYVVQTYDSLKLKYSLEVPDGKVSLSSLRFAMDRCLEYVGSQKHLDIDKDYSRVNQEDWTSFLNDFGLIVHDGEKFKRHNELQLIPLIIQSRCILKDVSKYWSEFETDGFRNVWILKPGNKCRGRGIILVKYLKEVEKIMQLKLKYVVQKYIEKPLIIYNTKFDIRQWFLVTCTHPLTIWMYRECYLRFSSQNYNLENFHESLHLTNYAVQCKYTNMEQRDKALPKDNMWDCGMFREYLKKIGKLDKWDNVIYPGMRESIVCAMLASQDTMDRRPNTFEMYGADFILGEDFKPWLLEINCSPDMSSSTSVTKRMCPQFLQDVIKVVIDKRRDSKADVGCFELVYRQVLPRSPPYLGTNLSIRGKKMFRNRSFRMRITKPEKDTENQAFFHKKQSLIKAELLKKTNILSRLPKVIQHDVYKGPVIEDLIEELQKCCRSLNSEKLYDDENNNNKNRMLQKISTHSSNSNSGVQKFEATSRNLTKLSRFNRNSNSGSNNSNSTTQENEKKKKWFPDKSRLLNKKTITARSTLPLSIDNLWKIDTAKITGKNILV